jgi:nucleoid-associated protein YgaU
MGIWSFVKEAGRLVGIGKAEATQAEGAPAPAAAPSAEALKSELETLGLPAKDIDIKVENDVVLLSGEALTQQVKEQVILAAGNVAGVAKVDEQLTTKEEAPASTFYTVKKGDTLSAIAKKHYGNANKYQQIFEANKPMLKHPDKIYPGQVLRIPPA